MFSNGSNVTIPCSMELTSTFWLIPCLPECKGPPSLSSVFRKTYVQIFLTLCAITRQPLVFQMMNKEKILVLFLGQYGMLNVGWHAVSELMSLH
jgi:hypothetical protein